jgi:hypothetical protein
MNAKQLLLHQVSVGLLSRDLLHHSISCWWVKSSIPSPNRSCMHGYNVHDEANPADAAKHSELIRVDFLV